MIVLTAAEVAFALLLAWLVLRTKLVSHAAASGRFGAPELLVLLAMGVCLTIFVFVLAFRQWRLSPRGRVRLLLAIYLSLLLSFCGVAWYDVTVATAPLPGAPSLHHRVVVQSAAALLSIGALLAGMVAVTAVLCLERRSLNRRG